MCAVDCDVVEMEPPALSLDSSAGGDEGSSSLSSVAEEEEEVVSGVDYVKKKKSKSHSERVKIMCSYGGRILPRPQDNQLRYVGGETRILVVKKGVRFRDLMEKLSRLAGRNVVLKYQLPSEDLDALISVTSDEDVANMMDEHDKMQKRCPDGAVKLRAFLFPAPTRGKAPVCVESDYSSDEYRSPPKNGVYQHKAKMPRNHSVGRNLMDMRHQEEFGSLRAYQQQQKQCLMEGCNCERNYFQDHLGHLEHHHGHLDHHHGHHHMENFEGNNPFGKPCYCLVEQHILPPRPQQHRMNHIYYHPQQAYHPHIHSQHLPVRAMKNHANFDQYDHHYEHEQKMFKQHEGNNYFHHSHLPQHHVYDVHHRPYSAV